MYLIAKSGGHGSYGNGDINSFINFYINTSERVEVTASIRHIERFSKSGLAIYNSEVPETVGRKKGEEHRQLQSVMYFMQTQKAFCLTK